MGILHIHTEKINTSALFTELCTKEAKIAVVGLGKEGLSLALKMASKYRVIGYDSNRDVTTVIQQQKDPYKKIDTTDFISKDFFATSIDNLLTAAQFYIITTPSNLNNKDLFPLKEYTTKVAQFLKTGDVVVFQNMDNSKETIGFYIAILEKTSGLKHNVDFKTGYTTKSTTAIFPFTSSKRVIISRDMDTQALLTNVFKNITILKVIKTEKEIDINAVANKIKEALVQQKPKKGNYSILLKGITSKANTNKIENSKAVALYMALYRKGIYVTVQDNHVLPSKVEATYGIELATSTSQRFDGIVIAVKHDSYKNIKIDYYKKNMAKKALFFDHLGNRKEVISN